MHIGVNIIYRQSPFSASIQAHQLPTDYADVLSGRKTMRVLQTSKFLFLFSKLTNCLNLQGVTPLPEFMSFKKAGIVGLLYH